MSYNPQISSHQEPPGHGRFATACGAHQQTIATRSEILKSIRRWITGDPANLPGGVIQGDQKYLSMESLSYRTSTMDFDHLLLWLEWYG